MSDASTTPSRTQMTDLYPADVKWLADMLSRSRQDALNELARHRMAIRKIRARTFQPGSAEAAHHALEMWSIANEVLNDG